MDPPARPSMSAGGSLGAALLASLTHPGWWALALAGFLIRGGWLVVVLPVLQLPTTAGIANAVAPTLVGFVFGGASTGFIVLVGVIAAAIIGWYLAGGVLGAWLELGLVRDAAQDDELEDAPAPIHGGPWRALAVRSLAHVPTAVVMALGAPRLVEATYAELIAPGDPSLAVPLRVALRIPEIVAALGIAWLLGETLGGLAVRHLAWGAGVLESVPRAIGSLFRASALATTVATTAVVVATLLGATLSVGVAWNELRILLADGGAERDVRVALVLFSLTWAVGLWLVAIATTWRSTAWTFEMARLRSARDHRLTIGMTSRGSSTDPGVLAR